MYDKGEGHVERDGSVCQRCLNPYVVCASVQNRAMKNGLRLKFFHITDNRGPPRPMGNYPPGPVCQEHLYLNVKFLSGINAILFVLDVSHGRWS